MSSNPDVSVLIERTEEANHKIHDLLFDILPNLVQDIESNKLNMTNSDYYDIQTFSKMLHTGIDSFEEYVDTIDDIIAKKPVGGTRRKRRSTRRRQTHRRR